MIATAAGVTHTTFFRHFATKERVLIDEPYSRQLVQSFAAQPAHVGLVQALRNATIEVYGGLGEAELEAHRLTAPVVAFDELPDGEQRRCRPARGARRGGLVA